ncbi:MAG: hypothetical protein EXS14_08310 [Planctomycetes bacterium]|nr:hypothetical protein [Planctomycetota bacterium]
MAHWPETTGSKLPLRLIFTVAASAWVVLLHRLATTPSDELPGAWPPGVSNLMHAATHAVLALLLLRVFIGLRPRVLAWPGLRSRVGQLVLLLVGVHGLVEEVVQHSVVGRSCSVGDLCLDIAGGVTVLLSPWPKGPQRPTSWVPLLLTLAVVPLLAFGTDMLPQLDGLLAAALTALHG